MFPKDSLTVFNTFFLNGNQYSTTTLLSISSTSTILHAQIIDNIDATTNTPGAFSAIYLSLFCNGKRIISYRNNLGASSVDNDGISFDGHALCGTDLLLVTTAGDSVRPRNITYNFTYLPYNYASSSDPVYLSTTSIPVSLSNASTTPFYTQDSGNLSLALAIVISLLFLMVAGFMYNNITSKKPWR